MHRRTSKLAALKVFRDVRNETGQTALHAAAFMDRDNCAKLLLALGSEPEARDRYFVSALQMMVQNIPQSAHTALDQFFHIDKTIRKQYFYLIDLECTNTDTKEMITAQLNPTDPRPLSLLQEIVKYVPT